MHISNIGQGTGCGTNLQLSLNEMKEQIISSEIELNNLKQEQYFLKNELPKDSPIKIPPGASIKDQNKIAGYRQIKYQWKQDGYNYTSRWHQRTPNAPVDQGNTWVVERKKEGIGYGPNARHKVVEVLIGKDKKGNNIWIDKEKWNEAIKARKNGTATKKQKEMLKNGHWKSKK